MSFRIRFVTYLRLGISNLIRVAWYRLSLKLFGGIDFGAGYVISGGVFFSKPRNFIENIQSTSLENALCWFDWYRIDLSENPPNWFQNPFSDFPQPNATTEWWKISDFDAGEIKSLWELSRLNWVVIFSQHACRGDAVALDRLNAWLSDWVEKNPPYKGPHWKCGQEAAIRVIHLAMAALMLEQVHGLSERVRVLVSFHLLRIEASVNYAIGQDNNHGTSEAAALFIGGSWLAAQGVGDGERWAQAGRHLLENRAGRLIGKQGTFSQYSLNYHRLVLDSFSMGEVWRRYLALPEFSARWQSRALAAAQWLRHIVNPINGDGPNVGANDGARLLQLTDTPYRDHRPSVQLAMALFAGQRAYSQSGPWDDALHWLGVGLPEEIAAVPGNLVADDGGFVMLHRGAAMAVLRYPRFRFRPSQADVLHLDFWLDGENVLRDAGTYSYNADQHWINYFGGTAGHNTVQFDDREQMPRLGRFLLGDWLKTESMSPLIVDGDSTRFAAAYRDRQGARHNRHVHLGDCVLKVIDEVQGFAQKAVLRWRLMPGEWQFERLPHGGPRLTLGLKGAVILMVSADVPITSCQLVQGWESRHYLEKTAVPVLEIEVRDAGELITELYWRT